MYIFIDRFVESGYICIYLIAYTVLLLSLLCAQHRATDHNAGPPHRDTPYSTPTSIRTVQLGSDWLRVDWLTELHKPV